MSKKWIILIAIVIAAIAGFTYLHKRGEYRTDTTSAPSGTHGTPAGTPSDEETPISAGGDTANQ